MTPMQYLSDVLRLYLAEKSMDRVEPLHSDLKEEIQFAWLPTRMHNNETAWLKEYVLIRFKRSFGGWSEFKLLVDDHAKLKKQVVDQLLSEPRPSSSHAKLRLVR